MPSQQQEDREKLALPGTDPGHIMALLIQILAEKVSACSAVSEDDTIQPTGARFSKTRDASRTTPGLVVSGHM
jgi:hypothetical protein